jgi:hypothetical protein
MLGPGPLRAERYQAAKAPLGPDKPHTSVKHRQLPDANQQLVAVTGHRQRPEPRPIPTALRRNSVLPPIGRGPPS